MGIIIVLIILLNIPFGYWRESVKKFSGQWFLSIHIPVPIIVFFRLNLGLGWELTTFLIFVGAYCSGQWLGVKWHRHWERTMSVSSCLLRDIVRSRWIILISRK